MKKWVYKSENLGGNLHDAARYITERHPDWDVVTMSHGTYHTVVVYRIPMEQWAEEEDEE